MSGLDIAGLVFSILGIAETGAQLSQKLCNVYRRVKNANRSIDSLSSDVGLTCNVLRQLGDNLSHDEHAKLYSAQALSTAQDILRECKVVFEKINKALNESNTSSARNVFQRVRKGVGFVMVEEELHVLGSNLERLKSTMLLLLNVIMYAGQVRSRADLSTLEEQRSLIQKLVEEKKQNDQRFENLSQALGACIVTNFMTINGSRSEDTLSAELRAYNRLLGLILSEIDTYQSTLEQTRYQRVRNGILDIHSKEISHIRVSHGDMAADALNDRVAKRVEPSCTHLPRLPKPRRGDTAPISPRARHVFAMSIPGDDGLVVSSRCDYQLKDFPPPFDDTDDCNFTADEAGPPRKRLRGSSKSPTFDGSSVLIRHLEPNRPDLAVIETDHFPRDLEELQPCVDGGKSHPPDLQNSGHEARFLLEEERKSLPSSRKGNSSHSIVGSEGGNVAREQDTPSPSAEQPNLKENEPHVARSDSLPCLAPRQVRKLSDPDPRLIKLLTRPSSPITSSPITTNLPDLKAVLSGFNNRPGHPSADSDHISEAPAPSLDPLKSELLFPQSGLLDVQVIVRAWTTLSRDELNV